MAIALTKNQEMAAHWKTQIEQVDKSNNNWLKRAEKINKNYRDERDDQDKGAAKRLNLYWSNVQTLKPAIYSKTPVPVCERRFLDKDTTGKVASIILERNLRYEVSMSGFDRSMRRVRDDYLGGPGRGQVWVRYHPQFGEPISPKQNADDDITNNSGEVVEQGRQEAEEEIEREVVAESLSVDYVHWQDFYIFPASARTWGEVEGVGRRLFMSRTDMKEAGFKDWKKIPLDHTPKMDGNQGGKSQVTGQEGLQATIYEIWWKPERCVYFVSKSHTEVCKEVDDPLGLGCFFPCPEPLSATMTNDTMIPVPDYAESQDQYIQIDDLTKRIDILSAACRVAGTYDAASPGLKRVFQEAQEPNLIPIDSWAMYADKGGIAGAMSMVPIADVAKVLQICIEVRKQIIEDLDRTTGISDIMRGTSDARETLGGQRLKDNKSSTRLTERQDDMARFCRDVICIMGEIVSEHFSPETLMQVSGALHDEGIDPPALPPPPQVAPQQPPLMGHNGGPPLPSQPGPPAAMPPQAQQPPMIAQGPAGQQFVPEAAGQPASYGVAGGPTTVGPPAQENPKQKMQRKMELITNAIMLLRQDKLRGFRIEIETDSTIQGDAQTEKAQRIEFIEGVTKFVQVAGEVSQATPEFAPLAAKMLGFAVRGFRAGRDLETAIDDFCDAIEKKSKQMAANPPPNPKMMKAQAEIKRQEIENAGEQANNEANMRIQEMDVRMKSMDIEIARIKALAEVRKNELESQRQEREDFYQGQEHVREMERSTTEHDQARELGEAQHRQRMAAASKPNGASHA